MAADAGVRVYGLREVRKALRDIDPQLQKELRSHLKAAVEIVAADARSRVPKVTGRAADSIRAVSRGNNVLLVGGKKRVPYFGWLDFGGTLKPTGRRRNTIRRERITEGRFLYPAINSKSRQLLHAVEEAFEASARKAGF